MWQQPVIWHRLLQTAAIATVFFSTATVFDFAHRNIELFAHFRPQYLAVSVLLLTVFTALRRPVYAMLLLGSSILNASFVVPWYVGGAPISDNPDIRILNANVLVGNGEYQRLLDLVDDEQPDVIFLLEISSAWHDAVRSLTNDYPFSHVETREDNFGIAVFSRIALDSVTHVNSPPMGYPTIVATMTVGDESVTLINSHPTVPLTRSSFNSRNEQIESLVDMVKSIDGAVILTGDFNLSMWCRRYRLLEERTGLRNTRWGIGVVPTWPTFMPIAMIPIDHVLVSDGIGTVATRTGKRIGSDHLPLIVDLVVGLRRD